MAKLTLDIDILPILKDNIVTNKVKELKDKIAKQLGNGVQIDIEVDDSEVKESFKDLPKQADKVGGEAGKGFGSSFTSGAKSFLAGAAIFAVFSAGASLVKGATTEFKDFNAQLQNVESLGVKNVDALSQKINELSKTTVDTASSLTAGLYDTISAGITGTQEQLVGFVEQASKVAVAGNATTADAVKGLTGVLNSYGQGVENAGRVSDIFFGTVKNGVVTFPELNASLSAVLPAAAAAGIKFEELAGNIAQMTAKNVPAAQATTQLRAAIIELQKPGKDLQEAMKGVSVTIGGVKQSLTENNIGEVLKQQGLTKTLQDIEQSATASGKSMTQVFSSSEAASAALLLTGQNAESANIQLQNIKDGIEEGVSTSAYEAQFKSLDNQMALVGNNLQAGFNTVFTSLLPFVNEILASLLPLIQDGFNNIVPIVENLFELLKPVFSSLLTIIGPILTVITTTLGVVVSSFNFLFQGIQIGLPFIIAFSAAVAIGNANLIKNTAITKAKLFWDKAVSTATLVWTTIQKGLNLALKDNPIGLIITVIGILVTAIIYAYNNFGGFKKIVDKVWESIKKFAGVIFDAIKAVGKFLGLISDSPEAPKKLRKGIDDVSTSTEALTETTKDLNKELVNPEPVKAIEKKGKAHKENKKLALDYFDAMKQSNDELLRMAKIEDEISRIKEERSKNTKDDLAEEKRELKSLEDYRNKIEESLKDGFIKNAAGKKIQITTEERVDLKETLDKLNSDLKFASKTIEKLEVQIEIDKRKAEREVQLTITELQRERLEIEVDMGIRPKTDLLKAYQQDLEKLNVAITGIEGVEQEKLQNEKLKKIKQIKQIQDELNKQSAELAALAYSRSFDGIITSFSKSLSEAFKNVEIGNERVEAIEQEIDKLDSRRAAILKDYNDGIIDAKQYNSQIVALEKEKSEKVKDISKEQYTTIQGLQKALAQSFKASSDLFLAAIAKQVEAMDNQADVISSTYGLAVAVISSSLGKALAEGDVTLKKLVLTAIDAAQAIMNAYAAALFVKTNVEFPFGLGAIAFAGLITAANVFLTLAKSGIGGAYKGVYNLSESNKGTPGPGDNIPMMLKKGESVATAEATANNPFYKYNIQQGMGEDEYFMKFKLPQFLLKNKISMPSMGLNVLAFDSNNKAIDFNNDLAKRLQSLDETHRRIDKEKLSVAVQKDRTERSESNQQLKVIANELKQMRLENQEMTAEIKTLKVAISRKTTVELNSDVKVKGEDLEIAMKSRDRKVLA